MNKHIVKPALVRTNEQTYRETFTGQECRPVVHTTRGRVRIAYAWMLVQCCGFVFGIWDLTVFWVSQGKTALYPSKSGLMNKHIVKHIVVALVTHI